MNNSNDNAPTRRLTLSFAWVISLFIALSISSLYVIDSVSRHLDRVVEDHNVKIQLMSRMLKLARERSLTLQSMLLAKDPFELDEHSMRMSEVVSAYFVAREGIVALELSEEERELLERQHLQTAETGRYQNQIATLVLEERYDEAHSRLYEEAIPSQDRAMRLMEEFIDLQRELTHREVAATKGEIDAADTAMLILLAAGIIASVAIAVWMVTRLRGEIERRNRIEQELEHRVEVRTEELLYMATHDALTGLPNRSVFSAQLLTALAHAERNAINAALFFMDLDGFKQVNDNHGHEAGDRVLVEVCNRLKSAVRKEDLVARIGGDEFTLLIGELAEREEAFAIADKLIEAVGRPILCDGGVECNVGLSIGIAFYPEDGDDADHLLSHADDFMYVAKRAGKNRYAVAEDEGRGRKVG